MTAQSALVPSLERPVLAYLLLNIEQELLGVTGLMCGRVRKRNRARAQIRDAVPSGSRGRVRPCQVGSTSNLCRVLVCNGYATGNVTCHVKVCIADVLRVEDAVPRAEHHLGIRRVRNAEPRRKVGVVGIHKRTIRHHPITADRRAGCPPDRKPLIDVCRCATALARIVRILA